MIVVKIAILIEITRWRRVADVRCAELFAWYARPRFAIYCQPNGKVRLPASASSAIDGCFFRHSREPHVPISAPDAPDKPVRLVNGAKVKNGLQGALRLQSRYYCKGRVAPSLSRILLERKQYLN